MEENQHLSKSSMMVSGIERVKKRPRSIPDIIYKIY